MQPKISVIVPVYKVEDYIYRCVDSLLDQSYSNYEIILVDDGSPDQCPRICDEYAAKYENIVALHKKNGGLSSARNYGVERVDTTWIVFVDSDDYVERTYLEDLWNLLNKFGADMAITRIVREREDGSGKPKHVVYQDYCVSNEQALFEVYSGQKVGWSAYGKLLRRELLIEYPFPTGFYEDCACMYKILDQCSKVAIGDYENNYHYVQREGSILKSILDERHLHIFDICREFEEYINKTHEDLNFLPVLMYRRGLTQLLNMQSMPWKTYKQIFKKYRPYFRENLSMVLKLKQVNNKTKLFLLLLCTTPAIFKFQRSILVKSNLR